MQTYYCAQNWAMRAHDLQLIPFLSDYTVMDTVLYQCIFYECLSTLGLCHEVGRK